VDIDVSRMPVSLFGEMGDFIEGLLQVGLDVVNMFDSNAETDQIFRHAGSNLLFIGKLLMGRHGRRNNQLLISHVKRSSHSLRISDVCEMTDQVEIIDKARCGESTALDTK
jgi:hypothetical protein